MGQLIIKDLKTELTYEDREYIEDHLKKNFGLSNSFFSYYNDGKYRFTSHDSFKFKRKRYCLYFTLTVDNDVVIATTPKRYANYQFENNDYDAESVEYYIIPISFSTKISSFFEKRRECIKAKFVKHFKISSINKLLYIIKSDPKKYLIIANIVLFFTIFIATSLGVISATTFRQSLYTFIISILFFNQFLDHRSQKKNELKE